MTEASGPSPPRPTAGHWFTRQIGRRRETGFALAYSFKYSARPGTPAANMHGQVPEAEKDARLQALQALLREQQQDFNAGCVGREVEVLVTGAGRHPGQLAARSPWLQPVHFSAPAGLIGGMARVRLDAAHPNSLSATLLAATSPVAGLLDPVQPVSEHATA